MIGVLKAVIRKYMGRQPAWQWSDIVPYALMALRLAPARSHGLPPFTILTGQVPVLPSELPLEPLDEPLTDATPKEEAAYVAEMVARVDQLREATAARLSRGDRLL